MLALWRIVTMFAGYSAACIAAALVLTLGTLTPQWNDFFAALGLQSAHAQSAALWVVVGLGAAVIFALGLLPTLLVIALTEGLKLRSIVIYGAIGGALALAMVYGLDFGGHFTVGNSDFNREREVFAAAGIAGGLVYWLFAGRRAGQWK